MKTTGVFIAEVHYKDFIAKVHYEDHRCLYSRGSL